MRTYAVVVPKQLYVSVGSVDEPRCPIWKLWSQGDEFYAQQIDGSRLFKLSVHSSGICRLAQIDRTASPAIDEKLDKDPHVLARWNIAGVGDTAEPTACLSVMVPSVYVGPRDSYRDSPGGYRANRTIWARAAPLGGCTDIDCVRSREEPVIAGHEVLGTIDLRCGSKIWVMRGERKLTTESFANFQREMAEAVFKHDGPRDTPMYGHILIPASQNPHPAIWNMAFGKYNLRSSDS